MEYNGTDPSGGAPEEDEEVRLMEHNQRFQAAVLKSMEIQIGQMEEHLGTYQHELKMSQHAREDMALSFTQVKQELRKMKTLFDKNTADLDKVSRENKVLITERNVLQIQKNQIEKEKNQISTTLHRTSEELKTAVSEAIASKQLLQAFNNDLNVSRQIGDNYKTENVTIRNKLKQAEGQIAQGVQKFENKCLELKQLERALDDQEGETKKAQMALERVVTELDLKTAAYNMAAKQLESAQQAIVQRSAATLALNTSRVTTMRELDLSKMEKSVTASENKDLIKERDVLTTQLDRATAELIAMGHELKARAEKVQELTDNLGRSEDSCKRTQQDLDKSQSLVQQYSNMCNSLQSSLQLARTRYEELKKVHLNEMEAANIVLDQDKVALRKLSKRAASELSEAKRRIANLDNERQAEKFQSITLEQKLSVLEVVNQRLDSELKILLNKYNEAQNDICSLEDDLERSTYRANKNENDCNMMRAELDATRRNRTCELESTIVQLDKEVKRKQAELEKVNQHFLNIEKAVAASERKLSLFNTDQSSLEAKHLLALTVLEKTKTLNENLEKRHIDDTKEKEIIRLELNKTSKKLTEEKDRSAVLEKKLEDARFSLKQREAELEAEVSSLRAQVANHARRAEQKINFQLDTEKIQAQSERQIAMLKLRIDTLNKLVETLKADLLETKAKVKSADVLKFRNEQQTKEWAEQFEAVFKKQVQARTARINERLGPLHTADLGASKSPASLPSLAARSLARDRKITPPLSSSRNGILILNILGIRRFFGAYLS
jgi:rootletin